MVLTNRLSVVLMLLPFMIAASVGQTHGATIRAASVAYEDVRAAVAAAASGDIVVVPAGSATWLSTLKITKRIWLVGAGSWPDDHRKRRGVARLHHQLRSQPMPPARRSFA